MIQHLSIRCKLISLNAERRADRFVRAEMTAEVRQAAKILAMKLLTPVDGPVRIIATPFQKRGPLADAGNHLPTVKAAVDGLVDAKIIVDDKPVYVTELCLRAPQRASGDHESLVIGVEAVSPSPPA